MKSSLILSLSPNVGHISHVVAFYKMFIDLGYESSIHVNDKIRSFLPKGIKLLTKDAGDEFSVVLIESPNLRNVLEILKFRISGKCKVIYVYHEPLLSFSSFLKAGFSFSHVCWIYIGDLVEKFCVMMSSNVLLPSRKAMSNYESGIYKKLNANHLYFPLVFDDSKQNEIIDRGYFSYIGTVAADHAFEEFLNFACYIVKQNKLLQMRILIATSSEFDVPEILLNSSRVEIQKGRYLTNDEIDRYYSSTKVLWNAYNRMTQSGVLAKAFMFGTPAIMMRHNLNEFVHDGVEVVAIDDNKSNEQIENATRKIIEDFDKFSDNCRNRFLQSFYYKAHNSEMERLLQK